VRKRRRPGAATARSAATSAARGKPRRAASSSARTPRRPRAPKATKRVFPDPELAAATLAAAARLEADAALLALSRDLAEARSEEQITDAVARALQVLFPGRSFAVRLVDHRTLALRTLHASGRLRSGARARIALRRAAIEKTGMSLPALEEQGVLITEVDEPLFEGCAVATAVPLAVGGQLFGVVNLEYAAGRADERVRDAPLLFRVANHAALGVRNLRSIEELTYLKTYLENLIEHANAFVLVVDRSRELTVWNAALVRATGLEREATLGEDLLSLVRPEDRAALGKVLDRGFAGEAVAGFETRLLRATGGEARVAFNTAPVVGGSGEVDDVIAIGQDLTLIRSLQAAAEHAERLAGIGRLVAGVVHELNNPLTAVNMYSDVLVEKLTHAGHDPADVEKVKAIHEAGMRIQRLARDLVAYAKPSGARTEPVELEGVIEEAVRLAKPALKEHAAVVEKKLDAAPPVEGSRSSLVQVVVNLVRNAAQAISEGGHVSVSLAPEGASVKLTVADDGAGMEPEIAARAFEPFFTTKGGQGIGLGLPIVQGIIERHGGSVALVTSPGKGTQVTVSLPVTRAR
jgi:PAS domain S-box-containing protein